MTMIGIGTHIYGRWNNLWYVWKCTSVTCAASMLNMFGTTTWRLLIRRFRDFASEWLFQIKTTNKRTILKLGDISTELKADKIRTVKVLGEIFPVSSHRRLALSLTARSFRIQAYNGRPSRLERPFFGWQTKTVARAARDEFGAAIAFARRYVINFWDRLWASPSQSIQIFILCVIKYNMYMHVNKR